MDYEAWYKNLSIRDKSQEILMKNIEYNPVLTNKKIKK